MTWEAPLVIYDDEDEDALLSNFVELMAAHYPRYTEYVIAEQVFKGLRDPTLRSFQAANRWANDLDVSERIRKAKLNGNKEAKPLTKEEWLSKVMAVTEDETISASDKKVRLEGLRLYGESQKGWFIKAVDNTITDKTPKLPNIRYAVYED
jgi:hypothetical protein